MKFINYLQDITGISIYPLVSLVLFVTFFLGVLLFVYKTPKKELQAQGHIPLEQ